MKRSLCIHGHFYQPPRENPWLEAVEVQDGAAPYHDWNQRITAECYDTNAASRILDDRMRIIHIVSNYAKMSFDIGPTLLQWLEKHSPSTYAAILDADKQSVQWRSGHGAAMAQAYNHMIMPLTSKRDKETQVLWGIEDFRHRFGREPEGMWLPEMAVDLETLDMLASRGIAFTLLAPHQASKVRKAGSGGWTDVSGSKVDPKMPYACNLPSGRKMAIFFYDGPVSTAVAFERLLESGEAFAKRLMSGFAENGEPQLMHIATDGESYGHHHRFGDMALAYALNHIETKNLARITNYGEYLANNPPTHEVEIFENTSWSCAHGVERWKGNCGCSTGANPKWNQHWREALRNALDALRQELDSNFEKVGARYFKDPWAARNAYIKVILDRSDPGLERFFSEYATKHPTPKQQVTALKLLELQRHAMLMYTSCGWFFDDISGIETVQVLQYAGRAIQLAREVFGADLEASFVSNLAGAKSNVPEHGDGARIYERFVKPSFLDLSKVTAHFAISSVFKDYGDRASIYCYNIHRNDYFKLQAGTAFLAVGRCLITSKITGQCDNLSYCVLYIGNHDFNCGVRKIVAKKSYLEIKEAISEKFESGAFADAVRLMDHYFGESRFSLKDLFRDEQRMVLEMLLKETMESFEDSYRRMYEENRILMGFLKETDIPIPKGFYTAAEFILNTDLKRLILGDLDGEEVAGILKEVKKWNVSIDKEYLEFALQNRLAELADSFYGNPTDTVVLEFFLNAMDVALMLPFRHNLWKPQNIYYTMSKTVYPGVASRASEDRKAADWVKKFRSLGEKLNFNLESILAEG